MKERTKGIIVGATLCSIMLGVTGTALAASGALTLSVTPVNIKVNGEVFQPKDVNGDDVMVFAYNGTTYAPLRALAEAYGLQVGWDQVSGTATVVDPDAEQVAPDTTASAYADWTAEEEAAYQEFVSLWEIEKLFDGVAPKEDKENLGKHKTVWRAIYLPATDNQTAEAAVAKYEGEYCRRLAMELRGAEDVTVLLFENHPSDGTTGMAILPIWTID